jgi:hypothetical protein
MKMEALVCDLRLGNRNKILNISIIQKKQQKQVGDVALLIVHCRANEEIIQGLAM